ncbi:MAG: HigA family addiction module antidote protein [Deltaproteobacteria bacterium]|nr:HigA family addiction module antidote protein [Deltaproteobacteria bacterium]
MATERVWPDLVIPPGDVLTEELAARGLTQSQLARQMGRPLQAVNEIVRGKKRITGETALQLADALGTSAELWMRLEADHELNRRD